MTCSEPPRITLRQLAELLAEAVTPVWLLHATDAVAFRDRHLPGAVSLPSDAAAERIGRNAQVVVYGESPTARTARRLAADLHDRGIEVAWFAGGLQAWAAAGRPVEGRQGATER